MKPLIFLALSLGCAQWALADTCPSTVSTSAGSFELRSFIDLYGTDSLSKAQQGLDESQAQDCSAYSNSDECEGTIETMRKVVETLRDCLNSTVIDNAPDRSPSASQSIQKKKSFDKASAEASKDSITNPWGKDGKNSKSKAAGDDYTDISTKGCPFVIHQLSGSFHNPKTYICLQGRTEKCEINGKNEKGQITYGWKVVSENDCIHAAGWIDVVTVESNAANMRKATKVNDDD